MIESRTHERGSRNAWATSERAWFVPLDGFDLAQQRPRHAWPARLARAAIVVGMLVLVAWVIISARTQPGVAWSAWVGGSALLAVPVILFIVALLLPSVHRARMRAPWARLSTPEGVEALIATKSLGSEDALRERRRAALRACMPALEPERWGRFADECRAFGLDAPAAVVIARMDQFRALRRQTIPDEFVEPVEIGQAADATVLRSILRDTRALAAVGAIIVYALFQWWQQRYLGVRAVTGYAIVAVALLLLWRVLRSPTGGMPGAARSALAAPGIVVAQARAGDAVFRRDDSVLVIRHDIRRIHGAVATLTRTDGVHTTLSFPTPEDPRLLTLWSMWLHPRSSGWDERALAIIPADDAEGAGEKQLGESRHTR